MMRTFVNRRRLVSPRRFSSSSSAKTRGGGESNSWVSIYSNHEPWHARAVSFFCVTHTFYWLVICYDNLWGPTARSKKRLEETTKEVASPFVRLAMSPIWSGIGLCFSFVTIGFARRYVKSRVGRIEMDLTRAQVRVLGHTPLGALDAKNAKIFPFKGFRLLSSPDTTRQGSKLFSVMSVASRHDRYVLDFDKFQPRDERVQNLSRMGISLLMDNNSSSGANKQSSSSPNVKGVTPAKEEIPAKTIERPISSTETDGLTPRDVKSAEEEAKRFQLSLLQRARGKPSQTPSKKPKPDDQSMKRGGGE